MNNLSIYLSHGYTNRMSKYLSKVLPDRYILSLFLRNIANQKISGCLLFGNDQPSINRNFLNIASKISPNLNDDFLVANLTNQRIKEEGEQVIFDEFFSMAMLGGRKLILIRDIEKSYSKAIESLIKDQKSIDKSDNFLLINIL